MSKAGNAILRSVVIGSAFAATGGAIGLAVQHKFVERAKAERLEWVREATAKVESEEKAKRDIQTPVPK